MSKQLDLSTPLDQDQIDELLSKHPVEKVQYLVAVSNDAEYADQELYENDRVEVAEGDEDEESGSGESEGSK